MLVVDVNVSSAIVVAVVVGVELVEVAVGLEVLVIVIVELITGEEPSETKSDTNK